MDELNEETPSMSYIHGMADNKTTILIKRDALFATEHIAHEIGHVLGAGHGPDISKLKLKVPYSDALVHRGRNQKYSFQIDLDHGSNNLQCLQFWNQNALNILFLVVKSLEVTSGFLSKLKKKIVDGTTIEIFDI